MTTDLQIEYRWEIRHYRFTHTAKLVEEIPPERSDDLSETMAPVEHLGSAAFATAPWTFSAHSAAGLERKIRRYERQHGIRVSTRVERDGNSAP